MTAISCFRYIFVGFLLSGLVVILSVLPAFAQNVEIVMGIGDRFILGPPDFPPQVPSVTSAPLSFAISQRNFTITCRVGGKPLPGCTITVTPSFGTGGIGAAGHPHNGTRPAGCFRKPEEPDNVCLEDIGPDPRGRTRWIVMIRAVTDVTGANGTYPVVYLAPEPSGHVHFTLTGTDPNGNPLPPTTASQDVQIAAAPLTGLPASGDGFVMEPGTTHPENNFALPTVTAALMQIPVDFRDLLVEQGIPVEQVPTLRYTSLNLPQGGIFDLGENWRPPRHVSHRLGTEADLGLRNIPRLRVIRNTLVDAIYNNGFDMPVPGERPQDPGSNHWHLVAR